MGIEPTPAQIGGSARGYQAIFVASATLGSPGYDGQPAVYLYIAVLEVNVLKCRCDTRSHYASELADWRAGYVGRVVPGACSRPGPALSCAAGNGGVRSTGIKPEGFPSHPGGHR